MGRFVFENLLDMTCRCFVTKQQILQLICLPGEEVAGSVICAYLLYIYLQYTVYVLGLKLEVLKLLDLRKLKFVTWY